MSVAWQPPTEAGPAKVELTVNINGHGLVGSHLVCTVDDDGAFDVPAALMTALFADGISGFPTLRLTRLSSDSATVASGCVDLRVLSTTLIEIDIPGLTSCNIDDDCGEPQPCQADLSCG